jgi:hypothetical protein
MMGLKIFFQINVPFDVGLDHLSLCKISDHSRTSFFQNNYSNCEKEMPKNEKRLNAYHSNRAKKSIKIRFSIYFKVYFLTIFANISL